MCKNQKANRVKVIPTRSPNLAGKIKNELNTIVNTLDRVYTYGIFTTTDDVRLYPVSLSRLSVVDLYIYPPADPVGYKYAVEHVWSTISKQNVPGYP